MVKLINDIERIEFTTGENFSYDLDKEFDLISVYLNKEKREFLKQDFEQFFLQGRYAILNTFSGGILFLKEPEQIEKITIETFNEFNKIRASVIYSSDSRNPENIKYKKDAGKIESIDWDCRLIFPNMLRYDNTIIHALLIVIGKIVKRICEYGRTNLAYMKIVNEFVIDLTINGKVESKLKVELK
jgi:hypothetical protein